MMHQLLKLGTTVQTTTGHKCIIEAFLGGGGQGEVYRAILEDKRMAVKWYFHEQSSTEQQNNLNVLIQKGPPNSSFLWPIDTTIASGVPGFGYLMPLREARFKSIVDLMKRRIEPSFGNLTIAGLQLAQGFLELHTQGLCYRDISFGNLFFDPNTGDIRICDNDNVAIDGEGGGGVLGTPRFIAPEVVRGAAKPSTQTDLFSLSVLLFYLFHIHHPLEGKKEREIKCFDLPAMNRLYGEEPLFIFDPTNDSNKPLVGFHDNAIAYWPIYPTIFREHFTRAFTTGLTDPHQRVRESEWRVVLARLHDSIFYCGHCGAENFYDSVSIRNSEGQQGLCWSCKKTLILPFRLRLDKDVIMLNNDTKLFSHHLNPQQRYVFAEPEAAVQRHPQDPTVWGLKNISPTKWVMTTSAGIVRDVEPGRSVTLTNGGKINFGFLEGEIIL